MNTWRAVDRVESAGRVVDATRESAGGPPVRLITAGDRAAVVVRRAVPGDAEGALDLREAVGMMIARPRGDGSLWDVIEMGLMLDTESAG